MNAHATATHAAEDTDGRAWTSRRNSHRRPAQRTKNPSGPAIMCRYLRIVRSSFRPLQPYFSPVRVDAAWTEASMLRVASLACDTAEDDSIALKAHEPTRPLVDDPLHTTEDTVRAVAERYLLAIEVEAAVGPVAV